MEITTWEEREKKIPYQPITFGEKYESEEGNETGENAGINGKN
jgi:hypothetical protein